MGTYGKPNKILFIALISGGVDFSERTQQLNRKHSIKIIFGNCSNDFKNPTFRSRLFVQLFNSSFTVQKGTDETISTCAFLCTTD